MKIAVWIVSGLLAVMFLFTGLFKLFASTADLEASAQGVPVILLRIAGTAEVLGALGLIPCGHPRPADPDAVRRGRAHADDGGATITNIIIGEYVIMVQTVILGALAGWVAWVRFRQYEGARFHVGSPATG